jgi:signal transduction histidine kinase
VALDGVPQRLFAGMKAELLHDASRVHELVWTRDGERKSGTFQLRKEVWQDEVGQSYARYVFRTTHWVPKAKDETVPNENRLFYALRKGVEETVSVIRFIGVGFLRVTQGRVSLATVSGPITLYDVAGQAGAKGTRYFVWAMAITSVNLGLINLLPIPVLDGGHLVFFLFEGIRRKPLSLRTREVASLVGMSVLMLLMLLAFGGLAGIRAAEKRTIWVGMAKETAHQLGTPLSSLMGWVELLRANVESAPKEAAVAIPRAELAETLDDMEGDIDRLNKVAQRFSHIGSAPQLHLQDVTPVVREAVQYMRRRVSQREGGIEIRERYEEVPPVNLNRELLEWAVENLLTNAISALDKSPGVIEVTVERRAETEEVEVLVSDNGRGMSREEQRRAFEPGYTTKRRGWGLGLALARRVVEDYHAGRIGIRHSAPGQGTIMVIRFPT